MPFRPLRQRPAWCRLSGRFQAFAPVLCAAQMCIRDKENSNLAEFAKVLGKPDSPIEKADETALFQIINQLNPLVIVDESHHCLLYTSFGGQRHFQMNRNGADAILHVKAPFLGLSAEQTSRRFQIVGSGAFAEVLPVEADRDADFQDAVKKCGVHPDRQLAS